MTQRVAQTSDRALSLLRSAGPWEQFGLARGEYNHLSNMFNHFGGEQAKNGRLDHKQLKIMCTSLNFATDPHDVEALVREMDPDNQGSISLHELCTWYATHRPSSRALYGLTQEQYDEVLFQFRAYDPEHTGELDQASFVKMAVAEGYASTAAEARRLFAEIDTSQNGVVTLHELMTFRAEKEGKAMHGDGHRHHGAPHKQYHVYEHPSPPPLHAQHQRQESAEHRNIRWADEASPVQPLRARFQGTQGMELVSRSPVEVVYAPESPPPPQYSQQPQAPVYYGTMPSPRSPRTPIESVVYDRVIPPPARTVEVPYDEIALKQHRRYQQEPMPSPRGQRSPVQQQQPYYSPATPTDSGRFWPPAQQQMMARSPTQQTPPQYYAAPQQQPYTPTSPARSPVYPPQPQQQQAYYPQQRQQQSPMLQPVMPQPSLQPEEDIVTTVTTTTTKTVVEEEFYPPPAPVPAPTTTVVQTTVEFPAPQPAPTTTVIEKVVEVPVAVPTTVVTTPAVVTVPTVPVVPIVPTVYTAPVVPTYYYSTPYMTSGYYLW